MSDTGAVQATRHDLFDKHGRPVGTITIPDDIIKAAAHVYAWLRLQPAGATLRGLKIAGEQTRTKRKEAQTP